MEAQVVFNSITKLFDLILEINGIKEVVSTSKNYGHWQYHFNRGTLAKAIAKYNIKTFVYVGFTPSEPPPSNEVQQASPPPEVETSWFETQSLSVFTAKKRGRPRKYLPKISGVIVHKVGDDEPAYKMTTPADREVIERNFKMFIKSMDTKEALEELTLKFQIPYKQAYEIVESFI